MKFLAMSARALFFQDPEGNTLELMCHDPDPESSADSYNAG